MRSAPSRTSNRKASGMDGIPNFWLKKLVVFHRILANAFNDIIHERENIPGWLTRGKTFLLPKNEKTNEAKNYRPLTCLNTTHKVIIKILSERIYAHLSQNNLLPKEQKGCTRNTYGCKDHLLTSQIMYKECKT